MKPALLALFCASAQADPIPSVWSLVSGGVW
jgi:hypothetical protein